jgi:hypothetical protein
MALESSLPSRYVFVVSVTPTPGIPTREAALAGRLIWWKTPAEALRHRERLLAQVMKLGTWEDIIEARSLWGDEAFRHALQNAPPGVLDARSWSYWHHVLGMGPVPPLPVRQLP